MARQFTQKHYTAVADTLVAAYKHPALTIAHKGMSTEDQRRAARHGIALVRGAFVGVFIADSPKFDCEKFHKYIETRIA